MELGKIEGVCPVLDLSCDGSLRSCCCADPLSVPVLERLCRGIVITLSEISTVGVETWKPEPNTPETIRNESR